MDSRAVSADANFSRSVSDGGGLEGASGRAPDFRIPITRGIGKFIENISPKLLKNNFNKILFADDDPAIHIFIDRVLVNSGYVVEHAMCGSEALDIIRRRMPDFLLVDWEMPSMTGLSLCETLRSTAQDKYLYILLVTSRNLVRDKVRAIAAGADDFLVKPLLAGELLSRLQAGTRILEQQMLLREISTHDALTGLWNRNAFWAVLEREWERARSQGSPLSCAMIDLDLFKKINDRFGRRHGDRVLARIGELLDRFCREGEIACRFADDEFGVLLTGADSNAALARLEQLRAAVERESRQAAEDAAFPTVTVGVAENAGDLETPEAFLSRVEESLLFGKIKRRNAVTAYNATTNSYAVFSEECGLTIELR
jgi:diguanylate cyclase (GGDEF)-like protein